MRVRIKPLIDFATDERAFFTGRYYYIDESLANKLQKENKVLIKRIWQRGDVQFSQYQ